jgi:hypothetical protein
VKVNNIALPGDQFFQEKPPRGGRHLGLTLCGDDREILSQRRIFAHKPERAKRRDDVSQCETADGAEESLTVPCREQPQGKTVAKGVPPRREPRVGLEYRSAEAGMEMPPRLAQCDELFAGCHDPGCHGMKYTEMRSERKRRTSVPEADS